MFYRYRMGEEAAVECDEGFELKMRASGGRVICTEDGSWKSAENQNEFPVCRGLFNIESLINEFLLMLIITYRNYLLTNQVF